MTLKIDWATHAAAKYACTHFHYSESVPAGKLIKVGAWEDGKFIGVVNFSRGANQYIGSPYGLKQTECCELTRVALTNHKAFVSEILSKAIKFLKEFNLSMRLNVSYADTEQHHHGGSIKRPIGFMRGKLVVKNALLLMGKRLIEKRFILSI
ncbi:hypothetical protein ABH902_002708 [Enterococcus sp. UD-01]